MILSLEVTGPQAGKLGAQHKEFRATGGTIGRLPDCSLVLEDPYVSSRHAVIHYQNGSYYIEDKSRNGISINSPDNRLEAGQRYPLKTGDRVFIDPYELKVSIEGESHSAAVSDPFGLGRSAKPRPDELIPGAEPELDLDFLGPPREVRRAERKADVKDSPLLDAHYRPPSPLPVDPPSEPSFQQEIPTNFLDESSIIAPPSSATPPPVIKPPARSHRASQRAAPPPASPAPPRSVGSLDLAEVLAGAGLENVAVTPELARSFGEIFRVVVSGVMDVLQARQRTKEEFRIGVTKFRQSDNNPLKFSANVDDALHNLLVKRNAAYLAPVEAFEDAFNDLRNHQIAMLAGLRVAFEAMLAEFDPDRLQEEFDRQLKKGALLAKPASLRYWDLYRDWIHDKVRDVDATFRELFGDQFAQVYEEQLKRLKAPNRSEKD